MAATATHASRAAALEPCKGRRCAARRPTNAVLAGCPGRDLRPHPRCQRPVATAPRAGVTAWTGSDLGTRRNTKSWSSGGVVADAELEAADPVAVAFAGGTGGALGEDPGPPVAALLEVSGGALARAGSFSSPIA